MVVVERRWRKGHGELDLVMRQERMMVFVEVRVRTGDPNPLGGYQSIGRGKWRVLRQTARAYLRQSRWRPEAVRFDVIGIRRYAGGKFRDLTHWEAVGTFGRNFRF
jgi:putative endonuclease